MYSYRQIFTSNVIDMNHLDQLRIHSFILYMHFQFQETNEAFHNLSSKKLYDKRNANSRNIVSLVHALQSKIKVI